MEKEIIILARKNSLFAFAAFALLGTSPAWSADSALGRITYIYPEGHRIVLDSRAEYDLAANVDMSRHGVAEFVRLTISGGKATQISPGPASLAGYWAGADSRS